MLGVPSMPFPTWRWNSHFDNEVLYWKYVLITYNVVVFTLTLVLSLLLGRTAAESAQKQKEADRTADNIDLNLA